GRAFFRGAAVRAVVLEVAPVDHVGAVRPGGGGQPSVEAQRAAARADPLGVGSVGTGRSGNERSAVSGGGGLRAPARSTVPPTSRAPTTSPLTRAAPRRRRAITVRYRSVWPKRRSD